MLYFSAFLMPLKLIPLLLNEKNSADMTMGIPF